MQATHAVHTFHICFKISPSEMHVSSGNRTFDQSQIIPERFSFFFFFHFCFVRLRGGLAPATLILMQSLHFPVVCAQAHVRRCANTV